jgi:hypothetical protein
MTLPQQNASRSTSCTASNIFSRKTRSSAIPGRDSAGDQPGHRLGDGEIDRAPCVLRIGWPNDRIKLGVENRRIEQAVLGVILNGVLGNPVRRG